MVYPKHVVCISSSQVETDEASNIYYNPLENKLNKLKEERAIRNRLEPKFKEAIEEKRPEAEHIK